MQTIGGGRVRYVDLTWVECSEDADVLGECLDGGTLEVLWDDEVMETLRVRPGDALWVEDGATVSPDQWLLRRRDWERRIRAVIPAGVEATARWSEHPAEECVDECTGLSRLRFAHTDKPLTLTLRDAQGVPLAEVPIPREATPAVAEGARVGRGQILAQVPRGRREGTVQGLAGLRALLAARTPREHAVAAIAPCDGRIASVTRTQIVVCAYDGHPWRMRCRRSSHALVLVGDRVRAGDALVEGWRSHHRLLRAWGETRLADHMVEELEAESMQRGMRVPRVYWSLVVRAMLDWRRIQNPGDTGLRRNQVLARGVFEQVQRRTVAQGGAPATAVTVLRGGGARRSPR